jgi:hypothetical protein
MVDGLLAQGIYDRGRQGGIETERIARKRARRENCIRKIRLKYAAYYISQVAPSSKCSFYLYIGNLWKRVSLVAGSPETLCGSPVADPKGRD